MDFILFCIFFVISFVAEVFYLFNGVVPLFWLPYVIYKICKREYKASAILMCIVAPIVWYIALMILGFVLAKIGLYKYLLFFFNHPGAFFGSIVAIICVLFNAFSNQARSEFKNNLEKFRV